MMESFDDPSVSDPIEDTDLISPDEEDSSSDEDDKKSEDETESLPEFDNLPPNQPTAGRPVDKSRGRNRAHVITAPVVGSGAPPPTPSKYEVLESSCDVCFALDGMEAGGNNFANFARIALEQLKRTSTPNVLVNPPAYEVDRCDGKGSVPRKTWGIPMV